MMRKSANELCFGEQTLVQVYMVRDFNAFALILVQSNDLAPMLLGIAKKQIISVNVSRQHPMLSVT